MKKQKSKPRQIKRGEVYICEFKKGTGSEQCKNRPVIIIQNDVGNAYSPTTIVAAISTQRQDSSYPMHVDLKRDVSHLYEDSTILLEQIHTTDKIRLKEKVGDLSKNKEVMKQIDQALLLSLGIMI
jgi:mRNA interferase MazF